jgi:tRNA(Ile)-lysidine synthase TilS/MesJ
MEDSVIAGEISQCALSCGVTRIALPDCAEDIAEKVLSNIFQGNANGLMSERFPEYGLPYMKPLREIPSEELDIYATKYRQEGNYLTDAIAESSDSPFDAAVRRMLADYSTRHPSAPHALRRYQDLLGELADRTT